MSAEPDRPKSSWRQNPEGVKADILAVATKVFAEHGFAGARMEEIVQRTQTSKRMIYYYFGDKGGLYAKVLETAYRRLQEGEDSLDLEQLAPLDAIAKLAEFTFDYHRENPDHIRLISFENIHNAHHLKQSKTIPEINTSIIRSIESICRRGIAEGEFRHDLDALELHWTISALCVFNISNRATFSHLYGGALFSEEGQKKLKKGLVEVVLGCVRAH